ncbi:IS110 family RNA-guided transposase [Brevibacterium limosum]|uniref:IS110 family transposase n=1 Tax=Brevibacterium limosum TaxID=2697565 RepID=UPI001420AC46|nr:IS110 family transposase [Brevibacterium limosum]
MLKTTFIGLDVHAKTVTAAALNADTGEIDQATMPADNPTVISWIKAHGDDTAVTYEAGPTGYGLARDLTDQGITCTVAAPSKLLRAPGDRVKTDQRDALGLARMLSLGEITAVRVPPIGQEGLRDVSRARQRAVLDLTHARQRINAMILRHGLRYPKDTKWTQVHHDWLARQRLEPAASQQALSAELETETLLMAHVRRLDATIADLVAEAEETPIIDALMCFRGISITTGFGLAVEIGDWTRFTGATIGSYLGLTPSEHSSGQSRSQGAITKAGNTYARKLLIEAAWSHARPYSRPGARLLRQFDKVDAATRVRAIEGNQRLHRVWANFDARKKRRVKANTAVARELAGWCWSVAAPLQMNVTGPEGQEAQMG